MIRPHPATLILLGLGALVVASSHDGTPLFLGGLALTLLALAVSGRHLSLLLRRSRWLLLAMLVMFGWLTPGTPLANIPGASLEGLLLAADNVARLLIALATVALLLKALPVPELVTGMRSLMAPLVLFGIPRDRIAVRLALTLNAVESSRNSESHERGCMVSSLILPAPTPGMTDLLVSGLAGALVLAGWLS